MTNRMIHLSILSLLLDCIIGIILVASHNDWCHNIFGSIHQHSGLSSPPNDSIRDNTTLQKLTLQPRINQVPVTYGKCVLAGQRYKTWLDDPDNAEIGAPAISGWDSPADFGKFGWTRTPAVGQSDQKPDVAALTAAYKYFGIETGEHSKNKQVMWTNDIPSTFRFTPGSLDVPGKPAYYTLPVPPCEGPNPSEVFQPTGGYYRAVYNPDHGALTSLSSINPINELDLSGRYDDFHGKVTQLRTSSDILWLEWLAQTTATPWQTVEKIFIVAALNEGTKTVIQHIWRLEGWKKIPDWQHRKTYTIDSKNGQALLGSPSGAFVPRLLVSHRDVLGRKTVKEIAVWDELSDDVARADPDLMQPNLLFVIGKVEEREKAKL